MDLSHHFKCSPTDLFNLSFMSVCFMDNPIHLQNGFNHVTEMKQNMLNNFCLLDF